jgi:uncharacterized protein YdaU (DUF1376 family)
MDTLEKGAYIMLIIAHMQSGSIGLPNNDKKLSRICGVTIKKFNQIKETILIDKFTLADNFWRNKKCIEVLQKITNKSKAQSDKALKRWDTGNAAAMPLQCPEDANHKPRTINQVSKKEPPLPPKGNFILPDFVSADMWNDFVKHRGSKFTDLAAGRIINQLRDWHNEGQDANGILNKSIMNGWKGVFPEDKQKGNGNGKAKSKGNANEELKQYLDKLGDSEPSESPNLRLQEPNDIH